VNLEEQLERMKIELELFTGSLCLMTVGATVAILSEPFSEPFFAGCVLVVTGMFFRRLFKIERR